MLQPANMVMHGDAAHHRLRLHGSSGSNGLVRPIAAMSPCGEHRTSAAQLGVGWACMEHDLGPHVPLPPLWADTLVQFQTLHPFAATSVYTFALVCVHVLPSHHALCPLMG